MDTYTKGPNSVEEEKPDPPTPNKATRCIVPFIQKSRKYKLMRSENRSVDGDTGREEGRAEQGAGDLGGKVSGRFTVLIVTMAARTDRCQNAMRFAHVPSAAPQPPRTYLQGCLVRGGLPRPAVDTQHLPQHLHVAAHLLHGTHSPGNLF